MIKSGYADLPLHGGKVPSWLYERMSKLGLLITEAILQEYGQTAFIKRMADPEWFQALGCVLGMDWHSSGITTSVLGALKQGINPHASALGIYFCGGRGRHSRKTPDELIRIGERTGLDGKQLVHSSRLTAKVDSSAVQDGYSIYLHSFILSSTGEWTVVQQGMNEANGMARRYHWHSDLHSYIDEPHKAVIGRNQGRILNLTSKEAFGTRNGIFNLVTQEKQEVLQTFKKVQLPMRHTVQPNDIHMRRLAAVLHTAHENQPKDFEHLLLTPGLGARTLQSLTLVSEIIHGTSSRFNDPARFSFAHGGKDGHPFPVPTKVYDQTIAEMQKVVEQSKLGNSDKRKALKNLHRSSINAEKSIIADHNRFNRVIQQERSNSKRWGGRVATASRPVRHQLELF